MTRAKTPPENAYFEERTPNSSNQGTNTNEQSVEEELDEGQDDVEESADKIPEYESESDVEATSGEENDEDSRSVSQMLQRFLLVLSPDLWEV